jgi:hypothetical protein
VKQAASILLMILLAFNWVGYRMLSGFIEHRSDAKLQAKIENSDYEESVLLELRVPLNAPYLSSTTEFESVQGEIEIEGTHYKYVKRKVENGELVLLCLPNENKTRIQNSRVDFFKLVNDLNQSTEGKSKNTASYKSFSSEYQDENNLWSIHPEITLTVLPRSLSLSFLSTGFNFIPDQPPKA